MSDKKEFYYHSVKMVLTRADRSYELYKVEVTDENGFKSTVYERTFNKACKYAEYFFDTTEKRKNSYDSVGSMIEEDKKAGRNFPLD